MLQKWDFEEFCFCKKFVHKHIIIIGIIYIFLNKINEFFQENKRNIQENPMTPFVQLVIQEYNIKIMRIVFIISYQWFLTNIKKPDAKFVYYLP